MSPPTIFLPDRLDQLLAPPRTLETEIATLLQALFDRRYTGPVTINFCAGVPRTAEFPAPQIKLC